MLNILASLVFVLAREFELLLALRLGDHFISVSDETDRPRGGQLGPSRAADRAQLEEDVHRPVLQPAHAHTAGTMWEPQIWAGFPALSRKNPVMLHLLPLDRNFRPAWRLRHPDAHRAFDPDS